MIPLLQTFLKYIVVTLNKLLIKQWNDARRFTLMWRHPNNLEIYDIIGDQCIRNSMLTCICIFLFWISNHKVSLQTKLQVCRMDWIIKTLETYNSSSQLGCQPPIVGSEPVGPWTIWLKVFWRLFQAIFLADNVLVLIRIPLQFVPEATSHHDCEAKSITTPFVVWQPFANLQKEIAIVYLSNKTFSCRTFR